MQRYAGDLARLHERRDKEIVEIQRYETVQGLIYNEPGTNRYQVQHSSHYAVILYSWASEPSDRARACLQRARHQQIPGVAYHISQASASCKTRRCRWFLLHLWWGYWMSGNVANSAMLWARLLHEDHAQLSVRKLLWCASQHMCYIQI